MLTMKEMRDDYFRAENMTKCDTFGKHDTVTGEQVFSKVEEIDVGMFMIEKLTEFMKVKLTRMEKRSAIYGAYPNMSIPEICIWVHGSIQGSSDPLEKEALINCKKFLECCLDTWHPASIKFDNCIKELISVTLNEIDDEIYIR